MSGRVAAARLWPFAVVFLAGLALAWPTLAWPMAFDDLHLMRRFTGAQILASLHGQWEPERLMTRGLRPLTMLFNHVRMTLFGEDVAAHRVFLLALQALYWSVLVPVGRRFGADRPTVTAAGLLFVASTYSVFHYVWITDGNHMLQGLSFAAAALALMRGLERHAPLPFALSLISLLGGLLVREDTLAAVPALLILGYARSEQLERGQGRFAAYALAAVLLCAAVFAYRGRVVARVKPPGTDLLGLLEHARKMMNPLGEAWFDGWSRALVASWWVLLTALLALLLAVVPRHRWRIPTLWLPCALLACTPGLNLRRDDLLFFPSTFACLFVASVLREVVSARPSLAPVAAAVLAWGMLGGAYLSRVFAENFHPSSLRVIWWNGRYVYGAYAERAAIPPGRREAVVRRLAESGIFNVHHHLQGTRKLERQALAQGRRRPAPDGSPFYPRLPWAED